MALHKVRKGLDVPLLGEPEQAIDDAPSVSRVAVVARDYVGMKPRILVKAGDAVRVGQPLFESREQPRVRVVAPAAGTIEDVYRGERRALTSIVVNLSPEPDASVSFESYRPGAEASRESVQALLLESGLWSALRVRPYGGVANPEVNPHSIFVTAVDTHPLAARPEVVLRGREQAFQRGLAVLTRLTDGPVYLCRAPGSSIEPGTSGVRVEEFGGKHPAGTVGYHIHVLDPVHREKQVFHIGYQDVARIGSLFASGKLDLSTVVSLGGPLVARPRLLRTRIGAALDELVAGQLRSDSGPGSEAESRDVRVISGSVLHGDIARGKELGFLGRYHTQVTVLREGREREFLGWLAPGTDKFSVIPTFLSSLRPHKRFELDTNTHGSRRAMVPIGLYERVMPMDLMITHLLRALTVGDVEWAEELGVLELDEEDVGLCTFVCPGKYEYGPALRRALATLEKEG